MLFEFVRYFVVPSFRRNLISISVLDKFSYSCSFVNRQFSLFINSNVIGTGLLNAYDNLYLLEIVSSYNENLHFSSRGTKRKLENENSASLWHKHLGHIFKARIERLVSDEIFGSLDFTDLGVCIECITGKQT